jgi:UDP:flavonoid glycosyltransferase YjiC (YdhE family)
MVTNGNTELALGALTCAVPLVVVPSILDQSEIAWRVQESGAGIRLPERRCTPERLRQAVQSILDDRSYSDHARRLAGCFTQYGGVQQAVALLAGIAKRGNKYDCEGQCAN